MVRSCIVLSVDTSINSIFRFTRTITALLPCKLFLYDNRITVAVLPQVIHRSKKATHGYSDVITGTEGGSHQLNFTLQQV